MEKNIQAVVLDLGEVLIRLDFSKVIEALGLPQGLSLKDSLRKLDAWQIYDKFERGQVSEQDFFRQTPLVKDVWHTVLRDCVPQAKEILMEIKTRARLFALTNSNPTHIEHALSCYPCLGIFEKVFTSFEIGARKPEPAIYQWVEKAIEIPSNKILFIDDRTENVQGARKVGWHAELCQSSPKDLVAILKRHFGEAFLPLSQNFL